MNDHPVCAIILMRGDLSIARRDELIRKHGCKVMDYYE